MALKIEQAISLLEQCLLYNDPEYRPFSKSSGLFEEQVTQTGSERSESLFPHGTCLTASPHRGCDDDIFPSLLSVDTNFNEPLLTEQYRTRITTPRARTTRRRAKPCKPSGKHRHCSYQESGRLNARKKSIMGSGTTESTQSIVNPKMPASTMDFLAFPGEVRESIYAFLFADARVYFSQDPNCIHAFDHHVAIRSTCKTIHLETARIYFRTLNVSLIYENIYVQGSRVIGCQIPCHILDRLQSLSIITNEAYLVPTSRIERKEMPMLRCLKVTERMNMAAPYLTELDQWVIRWSDTARSIIAGVQNGRGQYSHWLSMLIGQPARNFTIQYEMEGWGMSTEDRAAYMGALKTHKYRTLVVACSEKAMDKVFTRDLSLTEIRTRNEMYYWINKKSMHISPGNACSRILHWLQDLDYHAALDNIESGIAKRNKENAEAISS